MNKVPGSEKPDILLVPCACELCLHTSSHTAQPYWWDELRAGRLETHRAPPDSRLQISFPALKRERDLSDAHWM